MSWDDLTVVELKKVLTDDGASFSSTNFKRKIQIVNFCEQNLTRIKLLRALQRFGKLPEDLIPELNAVGC